MWVIRHTTQLNMNIVQRYQINTLHCQYSYVKLVILEALWKTISQDENLVFEVSFIIR